MTDAKKYTVHYWEYGSAKTVEYEDLGEAIYWLCFGVEWNTHHYDHIDDADGNEVVSRDTIEKNWMDVIEGKVKPIDLASA